MEKGGIGDDCREKVQRTQRGAATIGGARTALSARFCFLKSDLFSDFAFTEGHSEKMAVFAGRGPGR
jgi:hypothetical protein